MVTALINDELGTISPNHYFHFRVHRGSRVKTRRKVFNPLPFYFFWVKPAFEMKYYWLWIRTFFKIYYVIVKDTYRIVFLVKIFSHTFKFYNTMSKFSLQINNREFIFLAQLCINWSEIFTYPFLRMFAEDSQLVEFRFSYLSWVTSSGGSKAGGNPST